MPKQPKPLEKSVAEAFSDALVAFLTLQARQGMSQAYSEYLLYDPIVRVAMYRQWRIQSEYAVAKDKKGRGDNKRIDFRIENKGSRAVVYVEVKYCRSAKTKTSIKKDIDKLERELCEDGNGSKGLLIIAGRLKCDSKSKKLSPNIDVRLGRPIYQSFFANSATSFGALAFNVGCRKKT